MGGCFGSAPQEGERPTQTRGGLTLSQRGSYKCVDNEDQGKFRSVVVAGLPEVSFEFSDNAEERNWWYKIDKFLEGREILKRQILRGMDGSLVVFVFATKASTVELEILSDKIGALFPKLENIEVRPMTEDELRDSKRLFPQMYKDILKKEFEKLEPDRDCITQYIEREITAGRVYTHFFDDGKNHPDDRILPTLRLQRFLKAVVALLFEKLDILSKDFVFATEEVDEIIDKMRLSLPRDSRGAVTSTEFREYCKYLCKNWEDVIYEFETEFCSTTP